MGMGGGEGEKRDQPTPTFLLTQTVPTSPELYRNSFTYYTMPASPPDLAACVTWLRYVLTSSPTARVLVHDMSATSRAPSVVAAWMVDEGGMDPAAALAAVTASRAGVAVCGRDAAAVWAFAEDVARARRGGGGG